MYKVKSEHGLIQEYDEEDLAIEFSAKLALAHPDTKFYVEDQSGQKIYEPIIRKEDLDPGYAEKCVPFSHIYRETGKILSGWEALSKALRPFALRGLPDSPHPDEVQ